MNSKSTDAPPEQSKLKRLPISDKSDRSRLIQIAGAIAMHTGFVSPFAEDHSSHTPRSVLRQAKDQDRRLNDWAYELGQIARRMAAPAAASQLTDRVYDYLIEAGYFIAGDDAAPTKAEATRICAVIDKALASAPAGEGEAAMKAARLILDDQVALAKIISRAATPSPRLSPVTDAKDAEIELSRPAPDKGAVAKRAAEKIEAEFAALFDEHGIGEVVPRIAAIIEAELGEPQ